MDPKRPLDAHDSSRIDLCFTNGMFEENTVTFVHVHMIKRHARIILQIHAFSKSGVNFFPVNNLFCMQTWGLFDSSLNHKFTV